jgi:hypothetical protein
MEGEQIKTVRESEGLKEILKAAPVALYPVPKCGITPQQVTAAMQLERRKIPILICEDCSPDETYVVIPLRELPYFVVELYRVLAGL